MIFHFSVFIFSTIFFGMLMYLVRLPIVPSWTWYTVTSLIFILFSVIASRRLTGKWYPAYLPSVVSFSSLLLLSLIDTVFEQHVFIVVATAIFYASLLGIYRLKNIPTDETARALLHSAALASLFYAYAAAYGLYLNYSVPLALLMLVFFSVTSVVTFQTLYWAGRDNTRVVLLLSLTLGTVMGELIWVVHFWPFGYLTIGAAMLLFFYLLWRLVFDMLRGAIMWRKTLVEVSILFLLLGLLILSAPWRMRV